MCAVKQLPKPIAIYSHHGRLRYHIVVISAVIVRQLRNPMLIYDEHFTFSKFFRKKIQKKCTFFIKH